MNTNEVKNVKWVRSKNWRRDWEDIPMSHENYLGDKFVSKEDVDSWAEVIFRREAKRIAIPYKELETTMKEKNKEFYSAKNELFSSFKGVSRNHPEFVILKQCFKIPVVTDVDRVLSEFNTLSATEKLEILQRLGVISVKVEFISK